MRGSPLVGYLLNMGLKFIFIGLSLSDGLDELPVISQFGVIVVKRRGSVSVVLSLSLLTEQVSVGGVVIFAVHDGAG